MITTPWTKLFCEYLLEDEKDLSVGEMLTVYFGLDLIMKLTRH
jgi:hypothetical protein